MFSVSSLHFGWTCFLCYHPMLSIHSLAPSNVRTAGVVTCLEQMSMLDQLIRVFGTQMRAQRINSAVRCRTIRAHRSLCRVRVIVVPSIGHLLAARPTAPHGARITGRREHVVIGHCMVTGTVAAATSASTATGSASTVAGNANEAAR